MMKINEVSKLTGVSVRTLHHYDNIGLLRPTKVTDAGYRLYDENALCRLQNILLFRELQFPLKEIKTMLDSPNFDYKEALKQQIKLLELEQEHIGNLLGLAKKLQKGEKTMNFKAFDNEKIEDYKAEVKARFGDTEAFKEFEQRETDGINSPEKIMDIFAEFGSLIELSPGDEKVQKKVLKLQKFITDNFYTCTNEILSSLGQIYVADERFKKNIDSVGGEGTAEFASEAIKIYCAK